MAGAPSIEYLTIDGSRRMLAMSALTSYNCSRIPRSPPKTILTKSGDMTCHLETTYSEGLDSVDVKSAEAEGLVLMGRRRSKEEDRGNQASDRRGRREVKQQTQTKRAAPMSSDPGAQPAASEEPPKGLKGTPYEVSDRWRDIDERKTRAAVKQMSLSELGSTGYDISLRTVTRDLAKPSRSTLTRGTTNVKRRWLMVRL